MSSPNLPEGAFFTTINGRRCTAVPRNVPPTTTEGQQQPTQTPPQRQQPPPEQETPQRDPPQAEPPRETPIPLPGAGEQTTTSTSSTTAFSPLPPAPSLSQENSLFPIAPIRTLLPLPQASQVQNPVLPSLVNPEGDGSEQEPLPEQDSDSDESSDEGPSASDELSPPLDSSVPNSLSLSESRPSSVETGQTDDETAPSQTNAGDQEGPQTELPGPSATDDTGSLTTTSPFGPGNQAGQGADTTGDIGPEVSDSIRGNDDDTSGLPAAVIAGSVVGGVAFLTMLALGFWFWRKHRKHKNRRTTLLTPLSPRDMRKERPYTFDQESVGPTPRSTKFKAALGYNFQRFRGQMGGFFAVGNDPRSSARLSKEHLNYANLPGHSRVNSVASNRGAPVDELTMKDRLKDWWDRLTADATFNWRTRNDDSHIESDPFASVREKQSEKAEATGAAAAAPTTASGQPDFLTLLGMDEKDVEREAQRRRASRKNGSLASMDHFLGSLGLSMGGDANSDPFSDNNAIAGGTENRLASANPFSDDNAVPAPSAAAKPGTNYVADVRRSRGASLGPATATARMPSTQLPFSPRYDSMYRESVDSVETFAARRNKGRSDPFDLERPELLGQGASFGNVQGGPRRPGLVHTRGDSFTSKYSSGVASEGWSEPGPDVGSLGSNGRWDTKNPVSPQHPYEQSGLPGKRHSAGSQESAGSVGKAL